MFCSKCGKELGDSFSFCPSCGEANQEQVEKTEIKPPLPGSPLPPQPSTTSTQLEPSDNRKKKSGRKRVLIITGLVVAIFVISGVGVTVGLILSSMPSPAQKAVREYLDAIETSNYATAYDMMTTRDQNILPMSDFVSTQEAGKATGSAHCEILNIQQHGDIALARIINQASGDYFWLNLKVEGGRWKVSLSDSPKSDYTPVNP